MSRKLTKKQMAYLDTLYGMGVRDVADINGMEFKTLREMNDHETIYQNTNRYLWDKVAEEWRNE